MILVFLAPGFEEIEALTAVDILRRAELDVRTVGVGDRTVTGSHGIPVVCDLVESQVETDEVEAVVLPGGMPGTLNLEKSPVVRACVEYAAANDLWLCAICAAPSMLGHLGLLEGKRVTCFPGFEDQLGRGAVHCADRVVRDGRLITGKGPGAAIGFALEIVRAICSPELAESLEASLQ